MTVVRQQLEAWRGPQRFDVATVPYGRHHLWIACAHSFLRNALDGLFAVGARREQRYGYAAHPYDH